MREYFKPVTFIGGMTMNSSFHCLDLAERRGVMEEYMGLISGEAAHKHNIKAIDSDRDIGTMSSASSEYSSRRVSARTWKLTL